MKLVELENIAENPEENFVPDLIEAISIIDEAIGTWHTHPGALSDMSMDDQATFLRWPDLAHAIVGSDGIHWYSVRNGAVIHA
jgi:proteasome lid subunit RPN8/RPN11